jgi:uncharacterized protein (UPF0332 family)
MAGGFIPPVWYESLLRSATSRAYYAAFHLARAWAERKHGYVPAGQDAHWHLISYLKGGGSEEKRIAIHLERAKNARVTADYEDSISSTRTWEAIADLAIMYAEEVITRVDKP